MAVWHLLIYRLPAQPSRARVGVWRELRRLGSLPLGQSVVVLPELGDLAERLDAIERRIETEDGLSWRFRLAALPSDQEARLRDEWNALRAHEYAEIVEESKTKFEREIEFEIFRGNLTAAEAEEIEADLDKIKAWLGRVAARDWFAEPTRKDAERAVAHCEALFNDFAERVYLAELQDGPSIETPLDIPWGKTENDGAPQPVVHLPARRARRKRPTPGTHPKHEDGA
jgi:hypothetical protein